MGTHMNLGGFTPETERRIAAQVRAWEEQGRKQPEEQPLPFVTISREFGAQGKELGLRLVEVLNERAPSDVPWVAYDKEILTKVSEDKKLPEQVVETLTTRRRSEVNEYINHFVHGLPGQVSIFRSLARTIRSLAAHGHVVIVGQGGAHIARELPNGLHLRIVAPREWRIAKLVARRGITHQEALKLTEEMDEERRRFIEYYCRRNIADPTGYDAVLNNARLSLDDMLETAVWLLTRRCGLVVRAGGGK